MELQFRRARFYGAVARLVTLPPTSYGVARDLELLGAANRLHFTRAFSDTAPEHRLYEILSQGASALRRAYLRSQAAAIDPIHPCARWTGPCAHAYLMAPGGEPSPLGDLPVLEHLAEEHAAALAAHDRVGARRLWQLQADFAGRCHRCLLRLAHQLQQGDPLIRAVGQCIEDRANLDAELFGTQPA